MPDPATHRPFSLGPRPGSVTGVGGWALGRSEDTEFAVSRRCRHQLADLSRGHVDSEGCLVCPWHGARYDTTDGRMVTGPRGAFGYHGRIPGYTELVLVVGRVLRLAVGRIHREGDTVAVQRVSSPFDPRSWVGRA